MELEDVLLSDCDEAWAVTLIVELPLLAGPTGLLLPRSALEDGGESACGALIAIRS